MSNEPDRRPPPDGKPWMEVRLLVWIDADEAWRARVIGPNDAVCDFASPFELARFMAWPHAAGQRLSRDRLR